MQKAQLKKRINPGVASWSWNPETGELKLIQDLICNKTDAADLTTADLHMSPDNKFLYASLRDKNNKLDAILLYKINVDGKLNYLNRFPCENIPRTFCINASGNFMYVAGQKLKS